METSVLNVSGESVGKVALEDKIFGLKPRKEFLHEYTTIYLANQRARSAHVKTRAEVSGGGKKPWKQKHTGRARAGSIRSPLWRHGGVAFGPRGVKIHLAMPQKKARLALAQALSAHAAAGDLIIVDKFVLEDAKTRSVVAILKKLECRGKTLIVLGEPDPKLSLASRNIPGVRVGLVEDLNAYIVLNCRKLVLARPALDKLASRWN